ncbi:M48 family metalloprotease [Pseudophaeobacter sp. EL27]|uniref:M48 family metalloprotease n=1 Tax=Pseudophaeobacter sp. EL27 TaxID=2107580 RepID=UPI000EFC3CBE|nr:M48 family metalloprotease [Pseudophaeobacter sp. EL27]
MSEIPPFLNYHNALADFLQREEADTWAWFASDKLTEQAFDENRLMLLKNAVRLDAGSHDRLFAVVGEVKKALEIDVPLNLFQGTGSHRNAALIYTPNEINIMFEGEIIDILNDAELRCLLGHEMAHYLHKTREDGRYFTADRMLGWICGENGSHPAHLQSLWLSQIYQEIFADRVGLMVCANRDAAISLLIKVGSGLKKFSVETYLEQAAEALDLSKKDGSQGGSHPETYIRAIALADWAKDKETADARLPKLVEGDDQLERLDLLAQRKLTDLTRLTIQKLLSADWAQSEEIEAHARAYFPDFDRTMIPSDDTELSRLPEASDDVKDYMASVLLDFAAADPDLEDEPLLEAMQFADKYGLSDAITPRITKDLGVPKKKLVSLRKALVEVPND